jgi:hypothetical protein
MRQQGIGSGTSNQNTIPCIVVCGHLITKRNGVLCFAGVTLYIIRPPEIHTRPKLLRALASKVRYGTGKLVCLVGLISLRIDVHI